MKCEGVKDMREYIKYGHAKRVKPVTRDSNLNSRSDCGASRLIDVPLEIFTYLG